VDYYGGRTPRSNPAASQRSWQVTSLTINFEQKRPSTLYVAYLGMGLQTRIKAGENRGRELRHDFVVLDLLAIDGSKQWQLSLPPVPAAGQQQTALAIWVSPDNSQQVLQALGGYLE
jgi:hypothetical protein